MTKRKNNHVTLHVPHPRRRANGQPIGSLHSQHCLGYHESLLCEKYRKPYVYPRYVFGTCSMFNNIDEATLSCQYLNSLHPSLLFRMEEEENNSLSLLGVLLQRKNGIITSAFCKATFTSLFTSWNSFVPRTRKINLIKTLFHLAVIICSSCTFQQELNKY